MDRATIELIRDTDPNHPYPWRFAITYNGNRHVYCGLPNKCETPEEALGRAIERLALHDNGTHDQVYVLPES